VPLNPFNYPTGKRCAGWSHSISGSTSRNWKR